MKELKLGFMHTKELAEWMGVTYGTFRNTAEKRYELLNNYCDYKRVPRGVEITEIIIPVWIKSQEFKDDEVYLQSIPENGLSTIAGMARYLKMFNPDYKDLTLRQIRRRMTKAGIRLFGITKEPFSRGTVGCREYCWAVKLGDFNTYRLMDPEELNHYKEALKYLYCDDVDRVGRQLLLESTYRYSDDAMTKEEYFQEKDRLGVTTFPEFLSYMASEYNINLVRATKHYDEEGNLVIEPIDKVD